MRERFFTSNFPALIMAGAVNNFESSIYVSVLPLFPSNGNYARFLHVSKCAITLIYGWGDITIFLPFVCERTVS